MLKILEFSDFDQMYRLMEDSFPQDEYRPRDAQRALFADPAYRVYAHYDNVHTLLAFLAVWDLGDFAFLEHFAASSIICCILWIFDEKVATIIRCPSAFLKRLEKEPPTSLSEAVYPGLSALVESARSANTPFEPYSANLPISIT